MSFIKISFIGGFIKCEVKKISIDVSLWNLRRGRGRVWADSFTVVGLRRNVTGGVDSGVTCILGLTENVLQIISEDCLR